MLALRVSFPRFSSLGWYDVRALKLTEQVRDPCQYQASLLSTIRKCRRSQCLVSALFRRTQEIKNPVTGSATSPFPCRARSRPESITSLTGQPAAGKASFAPTFTISIRGRLQHPSLKVNGLPSTGRMERLMTSPG